MPWQRRFMNRVVYKALITENNPSKFTYNVTYELILTNYSDS